MYRKEGRDLLSPMETDGFTAPCNTAYFNWMLLQWHLKALSRIDGPPERPCIYVQQKQVLVPKTLHSKWRKGWEQRNRGEKYMYYHSAIKGLVLLVANDTTESPWKLKESNIRATVPLFSWRVVMVAEPHQDSALQQPPTPHGKQKEKAKSSHCPGLWHHTFALGFLSPFLIQHCKCKTESFFPPCNFALLL